MKTMLFWMGMGILIGYLWGRYTTIKAVTIIFKQFRDEMHAQYLKLLEKHGILDPSEEREAFTRYHDEDLKN